MRSWSRTWATTTGRAACTTTSRWTRGFRNAKLAEHSQALALLLVDIDGDGALDIFSGNDFALPDGIWLRRGVTWDAALPFDAITRNTMSLDAADIDNDGDVEIFAADMKPYSDSLARHYLTVLMMMARAPRRRTIGRSWRMSCSSPRRTVTT